jgi:hypothetical protein
MRCLSCNKILSDYESTRKYKGTKSYIDLCNLCFGLSDLTQGDITDRQELHNLTDEVEIEDDNDV